MVSNTATTKMISNMLDGTTPLSMKAYLSSVPVHGIVMFDEFVDVPQIASGMWEQLSGFFPYFAGGGTNRNRRQRRRSNAYAVGCRNACSFSLSQ